MTPEQAKRHKENTEYAYKHGLDKLLRPEELQAHINTILSEIADELEGQRKKPTTFDGDTPATTLGDTGFNEALDTAIQIVKERL